MPSSLLAPSLLLRNLLDHFAAADHEPAIREDPAHEESEKREAGKQNHGAKDSKAQVQLLGAEPRLWSHAPAPGKAPVPGVDDEAAADLLLDLGIHGMRRCESLDKVGIVAEAQGVAAGGLLPPSR